jgi:hypothetical protein
MRTKSTEDADQSSNASVAFDEKKLQGDVASEISRIFAQGQEFSGHDHRQYVIKASNDADSDSEIFIDVLVKLRKEKKTVARYAIVLQRISG